MLIKSTAAVILMTLFALTGHAAVIWDETVDGDAGIWWADAPYLGAIANGDVLLGRLNKPPEIDNDDTDGYAFFVDDNIASITYEYLGGTGYSGTQIYSCTAPDNCRDRIAFGGFLSEENPVVTFDVTGYSGIFALGFNSFNVPLDYRITFGDVSYTEVGEPGAFLFFFLGLIGLRLLGPSRSMNVRLDGAAHSTLINRPDATC